MESPEVGDIYPCLVYRDAPAAHQWLARAFGFRVRLVVAGPDASVRHSELSLGGAVIMVSSPREGQPTAMGPVSLSVRVDDPDAHYRRARDAGAEIVTELKDEDYGSRGYQVKDLEGNLWYFGTYRPGAWWDQADSQGS